MIRFILLTINTKEKIMSFKKLLNIVLLPKWLYEKTTANIVTLIIGILIVGGVDVFLPINEYFKDYFNKPLNMIIINSLIVLLFLVIIGFIDVICFAIPLSDIARRLKKLGEFERIENFRIRVMKVYILSHFLFVPIFSVLLFFANKSPESKIIYVLFNLFLIIEPFWVGALITRGISTIFNLHFLHKYIIFFLVILWSNLILIAIEFMLSKGFVILSVFQNLLFKFFT